ncbi:MAG: glycosyltransferase family 2 protein [Neisseria sp.]|nr:glycosyltransferase family 2 protein [Neisseria sp.]
MKLSILIVNYNTESFIQKLLTSLQKQTLNTADFEIIIVNNVQNHRLNEMLETGDFNRYFHLSVYDSGDNLGFGKAMNLAARHATGEHLLLMNPDILMLQDNYLEQLLHHAGQHLNYGVISTQILDDNQHDVSTYYSYEFNNTLGYDGEICWFQGSLLLIRGEVYKLLDGFDPDFFMYCEDVDLCLRIKKLGLPLIKIDDLKVYHFGGASEPNHDYHYYHRHITSQFLFAKKHYDPESYQQLVKELHQKSQKRLMVYRMSAKLFKKHMRHLIKWQVMYDVTKGLNLGN